MMQRIMFYLLILFAIFMIMKDPSDTGEIATSFFDWLGEGLDKTREIVNVTLGDESTVTTTVES